MFVGNSIIIVATAVIAAAMNKGMFIGGRFILGIGVSFVQVSAPTFAVEIAPPQWRSVRIFLFRLHFILYL